MNMQAQRPQPQNGHHMSLPREAGAQYGVASVPCQNKMELYNHRADNDHHDDGLVHGHFWAMSTTVR